MGKVMFWAISFLYNSENPNRAISGRLLPPRRSRGAPNAKSRLLNQMRLDKNKASGITS